jgi:hypothetical protein
VGSKPTRTNIIMARDEFVTGQDSIILESNTVISTSPGTSLSFKLDSFILDFATIKINKKSIYVDITGFKLHLFNQQPVPLHIGSNLYIENINNYVGFVEFDKSMIIGDFIFLQKNNINIPLSSDERIYATLTTNTGFELPGLSTIKIDLFGKTI